jgi:hypothetical protein
MAHYLNSFIFLILGIVFYDQGKYEEALNNYRIAVEIDHKCVDAYNNMGKPKKIILKNMILKYFILFR